MRQSKERKIMLEIKDISLSFGGLQALQSISINVREGELLAIIGPNGAGKTCIMNCINNFYHPQQGSIVFNGLQLNKMPPHKIAEAGIARVFQASELYMGLTVRENLLAARHVHMKKGVFACGFYYGPARKEELEHIRRVEEIIDFLEMEANRDSMAATLPYGLRKKADLGRALALEPKLLLLDEPMAGMNLEEKEDVVRYILDLHEERGLTMVIVEHDMGVVMDIAERVVVLDFGKMVAEGSPDEIKRNPEVTKAYLGGKVWTISKS